MRRKIQTLIDVLNALERSQQVKLAEDLGTSRGYLQQVAYGFSLASPALAKRISKATESKVKTIDIRPDIFGDDSVEQDYPQPSA